MHVPPVREARADDGKRSSREVQKHAGVAQLAEAPDLKSGCCRFESDRQYEQWCKGKSSGHNRGY